MKAKDLVFKLLPILFKDFLVNSWNVATLELFEKMGKIQIYSILRLSIHDKKRIIETFLIKSALETPVCLALQRNFCLRQKFEISVVEGRKSIVVH